MTVLLAADGKSLADRVVQGMTHDQATWFMDPAAFLRGAPHLWTLSLRVYCQRCYKKGLQDDVRIEWRELDEAWDCHCECSLVAGRLLVTDIQKYAESTDELLHRLGWSLCCIGRCAKEPGMGDGVEGLNDPQARTLSVRCGCTDRRYVMSVA